MQNNKQEFTWGYYCEDIKKPEIRDKVLANEQEEIEPEVTAGKCKLKLPVCAETSESIVLTEPDKEFIFWFVTTSEEKVAI